MDELIAEEKHWNECRMIAQYDDELKEAKRLLRLAIEDINAAEACDTCEYYPVINSDMCQRDDCYKWRYANEVLKLIGGSENELSSTEKS